MADYTQPDVVLKRVRFFDGQFLQDQDFIDEQKYHLDRERRQSTQLRISGIISGLTVTAGAPSQVTVAKGAAVDGLGRQLLLTADTDLRLSGAFAGKAGIELLLVYQESPTDLAQTGGEGARRWDESPKVVALAPDGTVIVAPSGVSSTWEGPSVLLARLAVAGNGAVTVDATAARHAGLSVPGAVGIGTTTPAAKLEVAGGGGLSVDLLVNGRLRSNNNDGGLWVAGDRFVGGHSTNQIGFFNGRAWRLTVRQDGNVGIGTANPGSDLEIGNFDARDRYLTFKVGGGNRYRSGLKLWAWQDNYGYSVEYDERNSTGNGLHIRTHDKNADGTTRLFVRWNGNVGVGTTDPPKKLTVSAEDGHLQLRREATESSGGKKMFLELFQDDTRPPKVPAVFPSIRFHHSHRFWWRIEAQGSGFHFKDGNLDNDNYTHIHADNIHANGKIGIGNTDPGSDLEVGNFHAQDRYLTFKVSGGNRHRSGLRLWAWRDNYGYSVEYDERNSTGNGLHIRTHNQNVNGTTRMFVGWNGNVGIGTTDAGYPLTVNGTIAASGLRIGSVTIGAAELAVLQKLAAGTLETYLYNTTHGEYLYAASDDFNYDRDRRRVFTWGPGNRVSQGHWVIQPR